MHFSGEKVTDIRRKNSGFSLIEVLVSIAILSIIIIPLLSGFLFSARVNGKSKQIQSQSRLAGSILEDIKGKSLSEIASTYNDSVDRSSTEDVMYYGKKNLTIDGYRYDVLIKLDATSYIQENPTDPGGEKIGYNTFRMPIIAEIDKDSNVLAMESYETELAVASLYQNHVLYCEQKRNEHKEDPDYSITEYSLEDVRNNLQKQMEISITKAGNDIYADVVFHYSCSTDIITIEGCGTESYTLINRQLLNPEGSIYLFYNPNYSDSLLIHKDALIIREIDVFVARQEPDGIITSVPEKIDGNLPDGIHLYSNVNFSYVSRPFVKKDNARNRIYDVSVQLYKVGSDFAPEELCAEFHTTKEE